MYLPGSSTLGSAFLFPRFVAAIVLSIALVLTAFDPAPVGAQSLPATQFAITDGRFFTETGGGGQRGFSVTDDNQARFWRAFQRSGGTAALGYPISQRFMWDGFTVQVFQRAVLQWRPERNDVAFVNIFDRLGEVGKNDWLRQTRLTPPPRSFDDEGKAWNAVVQQHQAVLKLNPAIERAYRGVAGDPLDVHGLPMSDIVDLGDVLVVRCQRSVIQQWKSDRPWAKAGEVTVALGGDIAKEAGILPDFAALAPISYSSGMSAPKTVVASSGPSRTIVLDPGHGGFESGAARTGPLLIEKDLVLDIAKRLAVRLRAAGHRVTLTRESDSQVNVTGADLNGDGRVDVDDDLQARVDIANDARADVFLSLHANGGTASMRGLSTFYCPACSGASEHRRFASAMHNAVLSGLAPYGVENFGGGLFDEAGLGKPFGHLFVIGPRTPRVARPNQAVASALIELLFISNLRDAGLLVRDEVRDTMSAAMAKGFEAFLRAPTTGN